MTGDLPMWLALAAFIGWVAGWISHAVYLEVARMARWVVAVLRRLYGWHRARDARRLAALERRQLDLDAVLAWGEARRKYDLAHPEGEHEVGGFSNRPAFHDMLIRPSNAGMRETDAQEIPHV